MLDLALHFALALALVLLGVPGWAAWLTLVLREQAQVGMKRKLLKKGPHPWKPWQWSLHVHAEHLIGLPAVLLAEFLR